MYIYLLDVGELMESGSQEQLDLLLARLDETRRKKVLTAKTPKTRAAALGAGLLLQKAVRDWRKCWDRSQTKEGGGKEQGCIFTEQSPCVLRPVVSDLLSGPAEPLSLSYRYGEEGKPYFRDLPLFFSISHSGNFVLCAVDGREIGADIQRIQPVDVGKLAGRFFSEPERLLLERCGSDEERQRLFFALWTRKEACGKLTGQGVASVLGQDMSADVRVFSRVGEGKTVTVDQWITFSPPEGYAAAICRYCVPAASV